MSYCRFGEADVYVFFSAQGHLECCGCSLSSDWSYHSTADMLAHLQAHRDAGDQVPRWVDEALRADDAKNFPPSGSQTGAGPEPAQQ